MNIIEAYKKSSNKKVMNKKLTKKNFVMFDNKLGRFY